MKGDLQFAQENLDEARNIEIAIYGPDERNKQTADTAHELGMLERAKGNLQAAQKLLHEALEKERTMYGVPNEPVAYSLNLLGDVYKELGDIPMAILYVVEGLQMQKELCVGGRSRPKIKVMESLSDLAELLQKNRQYQEATHCRKVEDAMRSAVSELELETTLQEVDVFLRKNQLFPRG
eukprot:Skav228772  [mRNA]  locus=scaffold589:511738:512277:- [translate_table: standard]